VRSRANIDPHAFVGSAPKMRGSLARDTRNQSADHRTV